MLVNINDIDPEVALISVANYLEAEPVRFATIAAKNSVIGFLFLIRDNHKYRLFYYMPLNSISNFNDICNDFVSGALDKMRLKRYEIAGIIDGSKDIDLTKINPIFYPVFYLG